MPIEDSLGVTIPVVKQEANELNDRLASSDSDVSPVLTQTDMDIMLKCFSEIGQKKYKIVFDDFFEITDIEIIKELKSYYSKIGRPLCSEIVEDKPTYVLVGSGHLHEELRGHLASACMIDCGGFNGVSTDEKVGSTGGLSLREIEVLRGAFDKIYGHNDLRHLQDIKLTYIPDIVDTTFYPKKSPNSYSEVKKQQAFFNKKRRK